MKIWGGFKHSASDPWDFRGAISITSDPDTWEKFMVRKKIRFDLIWNPFQENYQKLRLISCWYFRKSSENPDHPSLLQGFIYQRTRRHTPEGDPLSWECELVINLWLTWMHLLFWLENSKLGGGFQLFFFHLYLGKWSNLTAAYISKWVGLEPPPSKGLFTLLGTNISPPKGILKMIFLFPRWDMLVPWRVFILNWRVQNGLKPTTT